MKTRTLVVGGAMLAAAIAAGYGLYWIGMNQGMKMAAPAASGTVAANSGGQKGAGGGRKGLYWHDPMFPGQKFTKPGKSPFLDMQLGTFYADRAGGDGKAANRRPAKQ